MHRFFFAFGSGARMCLGRNISWMEMWVDHFLTTPGMSADIDNRSKLIPMLFMHYNMELSDPEAEWTMNCWWFCHATRRVNVRLTRRTELLKMPLS